MLLEVWLPDRTLLCEAAPASPPRIVAVRLSKAPTAVAPRRDAILNALLVLLRRMQAKLWERSKIYPSLYSMDDGLTAVQPRDYQAAHV